MDSTEFSMKLGELLVPVIVVVIGYAVARSINKKRSFEDQVKWPIVASVILAGLMLLQQCSPDDSQMEQTGGTEFNELSGSKS